MTPTKIFLRPESNRGSRISKDQYNSNTRSKTCGEGVEDAEVCYAFMGVDRSGRSGDSGDRRVLSGDSGSGLLSSHKRNSRNSCHGIPEEIGIFGKVLDPQSQGIRRSNRLFLLSCVLGVALDPVFLSVFSINSTLSCLYVQKGNLIALTTMRTLIDCMYVSQIWLQLKTAYVARESLVLGRGELVWDPKKIVQHYITPLTGFAFDIYIILPVPQIMLWVVTPQLIEHGRDPTRCMTFILSTFLVQYVPKVVHTTLMVRRLQHVTGYIFGTASSGFFLNLITYFIAAHVAGSVWYLLTVQRVESCLSVQCDSMPDCPSPAFGCPIPIAFNHQPDNPIREAWAQNATVQSCLTATTSDFSFGIYQLAVPLVSNAGFVQKILFPLFWGVMTFSCFGNALVPSNHVYEVLFCVILVTCGLLLFSLLIGNIQVFLKSITAKKAEMQLRIRDLEWWMRRRQLPPRLRLRVRQQERHRWAATRGVDEESLVRDLPEGLTRDIKQHLCLDLLRKVPLFAKLDDLMLNNICDHLKPVLISKGESIIQQGNPIRQMLFIVRGTAQSQYRLQNNQTSDFALGPGDFFGDELITWCLGKSERRLPLSTATLITTEMTEAFSLKAQDLKYITEHFRYKMFNEQLTRTIKYYSKTWRMWASVAIQLAWRRFKARRSCVYSGPLNFARVSSTHDGDPQLNVEQRDRLRMFTAMIVCPKPRS